MFYSILTSLALLLTTSAFANEKLPVLERETISSNESSILPSKIFYPQLADISPAIEGVAPICRFPRWGCLS
jgi:hypothetical protein